MGALSRYIDLRTKKDADNTEMITVKARENYYYTHLPQASEALAGNVGRGLTSPVFFGDEGPFQPNFQEALPAALAAGGAARELAQEAGAPYGTILTTTAGKKNTKEGAYVYELMNGMAVWSEAFYDARDQEHLYEMIKANSRDREIRVNITLSHRQLGKTDEWLARKISDSVATADKADRDFFNRWTSGTASSPLTTKQLEIIRASEQEPKWREISFVPGFDANWFIYEHEVESFMNNNQTLVVYDTSDASGGDDISMRVTCIRSGKLLATATINNSNIITFSDWVSTWLTRWDKTTMLIERKSTGIAVIDMLLLILPSKGIDPFARLYNRVVNNPEEHKDVWKVVREPMWRRPSDILELNKRYFGFPTSGSGRYSRSGLYGEVLNSMANTVGHLIADKLTIDQISSLIIKNGRVNHPSGEHDDMVISAVLSHWFLTKATNLRHYGIDPSLILETARQSSVSSPREIIEEREQLRLRHRVKELMQRIRDSKDNNVVALSEHELRSVYARIKTQDTERVSVDDLINSLREEKSRRRSPSLEQTNKPMKPNQIVQMNGFGSMYAYP